MTGFADSVPWDADRSRSSGLTLGMWRAVLPVWMSYLDASTRDAGSGELPNVVGRSAVHTPVFLQTSAWRGKTATFVSKRLASTHAPSRRTRAFPVEDA